MRLAGRTAVITGASRGIGAAVARAYAAEGAAVAVSHLPTAEMTKLATEVVDEILERGGSAIACAADIRDRGAVERMVGEVAERLGTVDILVNNAAANAVAPWTEITEGDWQLALEVNLTGAFHCCRAVYPLMRAAGYGKVINVSSVMVELGKSGALHYVTTKAGLIGFTRALAREVGPDGIRVNAVMPGAIRTEHELELCPDQEALAAAASERQCLPGRGTPDDVTGTFVYLASEASDFVTGQVVTVDGGWIHY